MLFGKIFYMIHRTISVRFLCDTIRCKLNLLKLKNPDKHDLAGFSYSIH